MAPRKNSNTVNVHAEAKFSKAVSFLMRKVAWHEKRMETVTDDRGAVIHAPTTGQIKWNKEQIALHMDRIEKLQRAEQGQRVTHDEYVRRILLPRMEVKVKAAADKATPKARKASKVTAEPDPAIKELQDQIEALTQFISRFTGTGATDRADLLGKAAIKVAPKARKVSKVSTSKVSKA